MVFNGTFNNISVISWRSVLLMEETGWPAEKTTDLSHVTDKLYHIMLYTSPFEIRTDCTDCISSYKSNYHTITVTTVPYIIGETPLPLLYLRVFQTIPRHSVYIGESNVTLSVVLTRVSDNTPTFCIYRWIKWNSFSVVFIVNTFHFTNLKWCYKLCISITF